MDYDTHRFRKLVLFLICVVVATQNVLALYFLITVHRLLNTGGAFPWRLKDSDTHFTVLSRWHAELHISVLDVGLAEVEHGLFHEVSSHSREGPVSSNDQISILLYSFISDRPVRDGKFNVNAKIGQFKAVRLNTRFIGLFKRVTKFVTKRIP